MNGKSYVALTILLLTMFWMTLSGMDGGAFFSRGRAGRGRSLNLWSGAGTPCSVVLSQNRAVLVASMTSFQKLYGLHGVDHQIIEYS